MQLYNRNTDNYDKEIELTTWDVNWIIEGSKVRDDYDPFGQRQLKLANEAIARADRIIHELRSTLNIEDDPFQPDDCQPEIEPAYDEYQEWQQMTASLRRGE